MFLKHFYNISVIARRASARRGNLLMLVQTSGDCFVSRYRSFLAMTLFGLTFLSSNLFAQSKTDSLHHTTAPPITVTSESYNDEIAIHPADIHTVSASDLQIQTGATRLNDALQVLHPSLDIRNYGSLGGISLA
ncbi:MAG: hypothetical protein ACHQM6_07015, partial [Candidatus Kapaibacterium sp.]